MISESYSSDAGRIMLPFVYRPTRLGALVRMDPAEARREILAAHRETGGNTTKAAGVLSRLEIGDAISRRTLVRYIADLGLSGKIDALRYVPGVFTRRRKKRPLRRISHSPKKSPV